MAVTFTLLDSGASTTPTDPHATGIFTATPHMVAFVSGQGAASLADPTGLTGLATWTLREEQDWDDAASNQGSFTVWTCSDGTGLGTVAIDTASWTSICWAIFSITFSDSSVNDGVVQNLDEVSDTSTDDDVTITMSAAGSTDARFIYGVVIDNNETVTWGAGFTGLTERQITSPNMTLSVASSDASTGVTPVATFTNCKNAIIGLEFKAAASGVVIPKMIANYRWRRA